MLSFLFPYPFLLTPTPLRTPSPRLPQSVAPLTLEEKGKKSMVPSKAEKDTEQGGPNLTTYTITATEHMDELVPRYCRY